MDTSDRILIMFIILGFFTISLAISYNWSHSVEDRASYIPNDVFKKVNCICQNDFKDLVLTIAEEPNDYVYSCNGDKEHLFYHIPKKFYYQKCLDN